MNKPRRRKWHLQHFMVPVVPKVPIVPAPAPDQVQGRLSFLPRDAGEDQEGGLNGLNSLNVLNPFIAGSLLHLLLPFPRRVNNAG
jgi:hypothetical protein